MLLSVLNMRAASPVPGCPDHRRTSYFAFVETLEEVPCVCGVGVLEVVQKRFGQWAVDRVVKPCATCFSEDIVAARKKQEDDVPKK